MILHVMTCWDVTAQTDEGVLTVEITELTRKTAVVYPGFYTRRMNNRTVIITVQTARRSNHSDSS
jgi:hypothetical protein